jgi:hypothetical protein
MSIAHKFNTDESRKSRGNTFAISQWDFKFENVTAMQKTLGENACRYAD